MEDIKEKLGFGRNSLIALALLLGSDYSHGVRGFGPESACQVIKSIGKDNVLQRLSSDGIFFPKKSKGSKKQAQVPMHDNKENCIDHVGKTSEIVHQSQRSDEFLQVINAYLKPKCHPVESDPVYRALSLFPFQRSKLQQICFQYFEWPPEKTDEYILPKIAERDLRRYANLRSSSSVLGLRLPLNEVTIKCPVAGIIKPRKIQGRECFEVEWDGLDGLRTSIVPADLVERACPERISEFEQTREEKKKLNHRKPRAKKNPSNGKASLAEIDQQLQNLLLEIESDDNGIWKPPTLPLNPTTTLDPGTASNSVDLSSQSSMVSRGSSKNKHCSFRFLDGGTDKEVIDLSSPPPQQKQLCKVSGTVVERKEEVEIIDLSDSDMDIISPEHARKARELRLFLAGIRKEAS